MIGGLRCLPGGLLNFGIKLASPDVPYLREIMQPMEPFGSGKKFRKKWRTPES